MYDRRFRTSRALLSDYVLVVYIVYVEGAVDGRRYRDRRECNMVNGPIMAEFHRTTTSF
jgi:hypothetical protein